jgi:drug/metabolite transporter (DMT)-like permease
MHVVAVTLGAILANEPVTWEVVVGAALVVFAVYVGAIRSAKRAAAADAVKS